MSEAPHWADPRLLSLGVPHGVTRRRDGDMKEEGARRRALAASGLGARVPFALRQVHGTDVHQAGGAASPAQAPEGDGLVTDRTEPVLCVFVADCMPIFAWDPEVRAVGVFHSGWRGTAAGLPAKVPGAFRERFGTAPSELFVAIGPHIGPCCYRVGEEVGKALRPSSLARRPEGLFADLAAEARAQLSGAGVSPERISSEAPCTSCGGGFFSYRRDKGGGRMLAYVARRLDA